VPGWRDDNVTRQVQRTVEIVRAAVAALPDREDLAAAIAAVAAVVWWRTSGARRSW
jgi:hypothetical protein